MGCAAFEDPVPVAAAVVETDLTAFHQIVAHDTVVILIQIVQMVDHGEAAIVEHHSLLAVVTFRRLIIFSIDLEWVVGCGKWFVMEIGTVDSGDRLFVLLDHIFHSLMDHTAFRQFETDICLIPIDHHEIK